MNARLVLAFTGFFWLMPALGLDNTRATRIARALDELSQAESVQSIRMMFPEVAFHTQGTIYERVDRAEFDFLIETRRVQTIGDIIWNLGPEEAIRCTPAMAKGYGVLRVTYKDQRVDDFLISEHALQNRTSGQCFRQPPLVRQAFAFWNRPG